MTGQPWDIRVTLDLFLGGLGIGVFLLAAVLSFYDRAKYERVIKLSAFLSPALVGLGLLLLISEIGRPERFITTLFNINTASVTSWGTFFQSIFMLLAVAFAFTQYKGNLTEGQTKCLLANGSIFAILVGVYHGLLLASLGRPLWAGGMVAALFLVSSLLGGTAVMMLVKSWVTTAAVSSAARSQTAAARESSSSFNFTFLFFLLAAIQLVLTVVWQVSLFRSGLETAAVASHMLSEYAMLWMGMVYGLGLAVPVLVSGYHLVNNRQAELSQGLSYALAALVIVGTFTFKHIVVMAGQINLPFFN